MTTKIVEATHHEVDVVVVAEEEVQERHRHHPADRKLVVVTILQEEDELVRMVEVDEEGADWAAEEAVVFNDRREVCFPTVTMTTITTGATMSLQCNAISQHHHHHPTLLPLTVHTLGHVLAAS